MPISIKDIVDELFIEAQGNNSILRNTERYMMSKYAKEGLKKLNQTFAKGVIGMNGRVPARLQAQKPIDFLSFVKAYILSCDGKTIELSKNDKIPTELRNFLIDCDGSIMRDCDNSDVWQECIECDPAQSDTQNKDSATCEPIYMGIGHGIAQGKEYKAFVAELCQYKDSWVKETKDGFEFSHDLEGKAFVIEYISNHIDAVDECQLEVPDHYEEALTYYVKYKLLEGGVETLQMSAYFKTEYKKLKRALTQKDNALTESDFKWYQLFKTL